jgi:hypothetical protein
MIEIFTARSGQVTARIDGTALHSPYDPAREAARFVEASLGPDVPSAVVILGEGLGYVSAAVEKLYPGVRTVRIFYSDELMKAAQPSSAHSWCPGLKSSITSFLSQRLGELDLEGLRMIEWPASARFFPALSRSANESVRQVVRELNGSFVTTMAAGRLWMRNSISNFLAIDSTLVGELCAANRPVVLAAAGPTLEEAAPLIAEFRAHIELWALPSSTPLLHDRGLVPDLIVMTDPGFYAMYHLHYSAFTCPLAMPLSAARGAWHLPCFAGNESGANVFYLAQPGFFETSLLREAGVSAPLIAPHGTVAATALDLALASTRAPVIVTGLDMCTRDISLHARPNAFDGLLHLQSTRLSPHYSLSFQRAEAQRVQRIAGREGVRSSPSLATYAGWFNDLPPGRAERTFRLLPSPIPLEGMHAINAASLGDLLRDCPKDPRGPRLHAHAAFPSRDERHGIVSRLIHGWAAELAHARTAAASSEKLDVMGHSPSLLSLAYYFEPQRLLEARRKSRQGDSAGAMAAAREMIEGCLDFLRQIAEKTGAAA